MNISIETFGVGYDSPKTPHGKFVRRLMPNVTIMGGAHGNETVGVEIINDLQSMCHANLFGTLNLIVGNPAAVAQNKRFVEKDLNRCFGAGSTGGHLTLEEKRANVIKPYLDHTKVLFDVHSTIKPSRPFLAVPNAHPIYSKLLPYLNIPTLVEGPGLLPPSGDHLYADSYVAKRGNEGYGGLGVTIEAGWSQEAKPEQIVESIRRALREVGLFHPALAAKFLMEQGSPFGKGKMENGRDMEVFRAYRNVIATDESFAFTKDFSNWEEVAAGTVVVQTENSQVVAPVDSYILFPKPKVNLVVGDEACILAVKR